MEGALNYTPWSYTWGERDGERRGENNKKKEISIGLELNLPVQHKTFSSFSARW